MPLSLTYVAKTGVPVEIEGVLPTTLRGMSLDAISRVEVFHGNRKTPLGELFDVRGDSEDLRWEMHGDLSGVHWIGAGMEEGAIHIRGHAGRHLGSAMRGGAIAVDGDAGDWVGGEMSGGVIRIGGSAGHLVGAAYRGSRIGMTGGTILIRAGAGNEIGHTMRRGLIAIGGSAGDLAGFNMLAGSIFVLGACGIRPGAGMRRGTLALLGDPPPPILPTFRRACRYRPAIIQMLLARLHEEGVVRNRSLLKSDLQLYSGDLLDGGRGEIFLLA